MKIRARWSIVICFGLMICGYLLGSAGTPVAAAKVALRPEVSSGAKAGDELAPPRTTPAAAARPRAEAQQTMDQFHPRDPEEWQGMPVNMAMRQICEESAQCGLGLSCLADQKCGACQSDGDCAGGEACVLDRCVRAENVECRSRRDCSGEALCILSGITGNDPRGNSKMRAYCSASEGPAGDPEEAAARDRAHASGEFEAPPFDRRELLRELRP